MTTDLVIGEPVHADRLAFLIDAENYFETFIEVVSRARRSVLILGWEVDSGIRLRRSRTDGDPAPTLADFLSETLAEQPELEIHILCWDWSMIYVLEREPWPRQKMGRDTHDRLHFELDGKHPIGASHHEKVVVIDDEAAFIGGIDLGRRRWDTRRHDPEDPRLVSPAGNQYRPFHDVQAVVSGPAARALGNYARSRWRRCTGETLDPPPPVDRDPWPGVEPVVRDVPLRVVRTDLTEDRFETEAWHAAALESAERSVYLENQYLTSQAIANALANALERRPAPEVAIVTSKESGGWLEQASMDAQRARILESLKAADPGGKVAAWWPDTGHGDSPTVHSKLTVVDDRRAYLGSANLSNRSMGLDTEIGLVMDADEDPRHEKTIAGLRRSLLAEHMGTTRAAVERAEEAADGLIIPAVAALRSGDRTLRELDTSDHPFSDIIAPIKDLFDPERPADLSDLASGLPWTSEGAREDD